MKKFIVSAFDNFHGYKPDDIKEIGSGENNKNFLVKSKQERFLFRIQLRD